MGCTFSYDPAFDLPITPCKPPAFSYCPSLVVPEHAGVWGFCLQPRLFSFTNDFTVTNQIGQPIVSCHGKLFSLSDKHMIRGMDGIPILEISKKVFGFHSTHYLKTPSGKVIATARVRISSVYPKIELYAGENYDQPQHLMMTLGGDIYGFRWSVITPYGQCIAKAMQAINFNYRMPQSYFVDIGAGVDSIFVLALVMIMEEIHEERERRR